jgi:enamine deaminase RidA (YjgF/YER057c/UK114 family)
MFLLSCWRLEGRDRSWHDGPYPLRPRDSRQAPALVLDQMKLCLDTAGSSLENVLKCNVYCTSVEKFAAVNAVYSRYFPKNPPARIFVNVPAWPGHFDIEIDCIAAVADRN